jgi:hypothetical protein
MTSLGRFRPSALALLVLVLVVGLGGVAVAATGGHKAGPQEVVAFANVLENGTLQVGNSSDNLADANISKGLDATGQPIPGVYCFTNLPFLPSNAVVAGDNSFGNNDTIASVAIDNATPREGLATCPAGATLRVRTLDANGTAGSNGGPYNPQLVDHRFVIWIRGDQSK